MPPRMPHSPSARAAPTTARSCQALPHLRHVPGPAGRREPVRSPQRARPLRTASTDGSSPALPPQRRTSLRGAAPPPWHRTSLEAACPSRRSTRPPALPTRPELRLRRRAHPTTNVDSSPSPHRLTKVCIRPPSHVCFLFSVFCFLLAPAPPATA